MKNLKIDKNKAKKLYKTASPEFKEVLIDNNAKKYF